MFIVDPINSSGVQFNMLLLDRPVLERGPSSPLSQMFFHDDINVGRSSRELDASSDEELGKII